MDVIELFFWMAAAIAALLAILLFIGAMKVWRWHKKVKEDTNRILDVSHKLHGDKVKNLEIERKIKGGDKSKI